MNGYKQLWTIIIPATIILTGLTGCATTVPPDETPAVASQPTTAVSNTPPPTAIASATPQPTPSLTPSLTATATTTPTNTLTPTPSLTPTATATATETATPTVTPVPVSPIGQLPNLSGQRAAVVGQVTAVASFSRGFRFTLSDASGQVTLLMWDNVYDDCWDAPQLNLGATVWALGEVGYFEGELQIVPNFGGHVKAQSPPHAPPQPVEIGALGNHIGQRVAIVGLIDRVDSNNNGRTIFVGDDSGEVAVFIWHNVFDRIPNRAQLTPGTRVRVVGPVSIFRDSRQIVPVLPYDVVVLP